MRQREREKKEKEKRKTKKETNFEVTYSCLKKTTVPYRLGNRLLLWNVHESNVVLWEDFVVESDTYFHFWMAMQQSNTAISFSLAMAWVFLDNCRDLERIKARGTYAKMLPGWCVPVLHCRRCCEGWINKEKELDRWIGEIIWRKKKETRI